MFCCYNLPLARPAQAKNVLKKKCCITVIWCYKYSLFGNKTNPVDLSLSVAIEVSGFGTCFLQWQRDFFQDALIINYCKRIVVTQLVVQTVCSANSFAKGKKLQAKRLKLSSTFELIDRFRTAVPKCPIHSKICSTLESFITTTITC